MMIKLHNIREAWRIGPIYKSAGRHRQTSELPLRITQKDLDAELNGSEYTEMNREKKTKRRIKWRDMKEVYVI